MTDNKRSIAFRIENQMKLLGAKLKKTTLILFQSFLLLVLIHYFMIRMKYIILIATLVLLNSFQTWAQVNVSRVNDPDAFEAKEGTFYYLPGTYLQLEVCFDRVEKISGPPSPQKHILIE